MKTLAIIFLVLYACSFLPGSAYVGKPKIDRHSPKFWIALARESIGVAIVVLVLT